VPQLPGAHWQLTLRRFRFLRLSGCSALVCLAWSGLLAAALDYCIM
jgi:hypothetical protein